MTTTALPGDSLGLLTAVAAATPHALFVFDGTGRTVAASPMALELARAARHELDGADFQALFWSVDGVPLSMVSLAGDGASGLDATIRRRTGGEARVHLTCRQIVPLGSESYALCFAEPTRDPDRRHRILTRIYSEIISVKPLDDVLETIVRLLVEIGEEEHATITLLDDAEENFIVRHEYPRDLAGPSIVGQKIPIKGRPTQEALVAPNAKPVIAEDLAIHPILEESKRVKELTQRLGNKSLAIFPLVYKDKSIGTFSVDSLTVRRSFSADDIEMFGAIANQAAMAIQNARLFEEARDFQRRYSEAYSAISLEKAADRVLASVRAVVECRKASVQLIVDDMRVLLSGYGFEKDLASPQLLGRIQHDPIVARLVESRKMSIIADTSKSDDWTAQPGTSDVRSWIGIPLVVNGKAIALITLDHDRSGFYGTLDPDVLSRLESIAGAAGIELNEAYRFDAAEHQIQGFNLLSSIAGVVATTLNASHLLEGIARKIKESLRCEQCKILLADSAGALVTQACWPQASPGEVNLVGTQAQTAPASPVVLSFNRDGPVVVHDFQDPEESKHFLRTPELPANTQSMVACPLRLAGQPIGVLVASHAKINAFSATDALLLETLARHTSVALQRNTGIELIQRFGARLLQTTEMGQVLEEIVQGAIQLTHTDSGVIYLVNEAGTEIIDMFTPSRSEHPHPRLDNPEGITRRVMKEKVLLQIEDISEDSRVNPLLQKRFRSMYAIPLVLEDQFLGVLYLNGKKPGLLTDTETVFVSTLADQAVIAIQRTRLDEQVRNSEAIYHSLMDHIPQHVFRKDKSSRFIWVNEAFRQSLGRPLDEIEGKTDFDFYPDDFAGAFRAVDQEVMKTGETREQVERHQTKEMPEPIWVKVIKTPVRDANNDIVGVQAIFWDITKEKQLSDVQERYRSLVDQSPDSIIVHREGRITLANRAARELFGASDDELKGRSILDFVHPDDLPLARERLERLHRHELVEDDESMKIVRKDTVKEVAVYARPLPRDPESGDREAQVVFHDLSRVNLLMKEVHHRVGRALNVLCSILTEQEDRPHLDLPQVFRTLRHRIDAMAAIHEQLRERRGDRQVQMDDYLAILASHVFRCYTAGATTYPSVSAHGIRLDEKKALTCGFIVTELMSNSLLHAFPSGTGGTVSVNLTRSGDAHLLTVSDDGCGFTPVAHGSGRFSGLGVVRMFVEDDLKTVPEIRSAPGAGTTVEVRFVAPARQEVMRHGQ